MDLCVRHAIKFCCRQREISSHCGVFPGQRSQATYANQKIERGEKERERERQKERETEIKRDESGKRGKESSALHGSHDTSGFG